MTDRLTVFLVVFGFVFIFTRQAVAQPVEYLEMEPPMTSSVNELTGIAGYMVDDFEDGNINGWLADGTQDCSISVSDDDPFGLYCLRIDGACFPFNGYYLDVGNVAPIGAGELGS